MDKSHIYIDSTMIKMPIYLQSWFVVQNILYILNQDISLTGLESFLCENLFYIDLKIFGDFWILETVRDSNEGYISNCVLSRHSKASWENSFEQVHNAGSQERKQTVLHASKGNVDKAKSVDKTGRQRKAGNKIYGEGNWECKQVIWYVSMAWKIWNKLTCTSFQFVFAYK